MSIEQSLTERLLELESTLESLEENSENNSKFEEFHSSLLKLESHKLIQNSQKILKYCQMGKLISKKSIESTDAQLRKIVIAVLFDCIDLLKKMLSNLQNGSGEDLVKYNNDAFATRLKWLSEKFKTKEIPEKNEEDDIEAIMRSLDL